MSKKTIDCISQALSPITHMSGTAGNKALINVQQVIVRGNTIPIPVLSGNCIRHSMVREPGADWLVDAYGLRGKLTPELLDLLYSGGVMREKGQPGESTSLIADMKIMIPFLSLLGCSLPSQIVKGRFDSRFGMLVCDETAHLLPFIDVGYLPVTEFVSGYQYVRMDPKKQESIDGDTSQMIFAGECVNAGALFSHGFCVDDNPLIMGCLLWSLRLWQKYGSVIGGQSGKGHGRLHMSFIDSDIDQDGLCNHYVEHAIKVKDDAVELLMSLTKKKAGKNATD